MPRWTAVVTASAALAIIFTFLLLGQMRFDPNSIDPHWIGTPLPPCFVDARTCEGHVLGTDELGRDVLARLGYGGKISVGLSLIAVFFEVALGAVFGILSRYGGVVLKNVIISMADALSCFPAWPFLVVTIFLVTPPTRSTLPAIVLAAITGLLLSPQIIRPIATVSKLSDMLHAVSHHSARDLGRIIVILATVDFFGFGIQPPTPTWGNMLAPLPENFQIAWWVAVFPAFCLFLAVLATEIIRRRILRSAANSNVGTGPAWTS